MDSSEAEGFKPPYMPFSTLWGFIGLLATKPLPPRIDRSLMASKSGTDQNYLTAALRSFGLMSSDGTVLPPLVELAVPDVERRKERLADLVRAHYPEQVKLSEQHGTEQQLRESFRDGFDLTSTDVLRKSVTFFLHAARQSGIEISANFGQVRSGAGSAGAARRANGRTSPKGNAGTKPKQTDTGTGDQGTDSERPARVGDRYSVNLGSGGTVSVEVTVDIFRLSKDDRAFVMDLVDKLKDYPQPVEPPPSEEGESAS